MISYRWSVLIVGLISLIVVGTVSCDDSDDESSERSASAEKTAPEKQPAMKSGGAVTREDIRKKLNTGPAEFPEQGVKLIGDALKKTPTDLTGDSLAALFKPVSDLAATDMDGAGAVVKKHGFRNAADYYMSLLFIMSGIDALRMLVKVGSMHDDLAKEGRTPDSSKIYTSYLSMSRKLTNRSGLSEADLRFIYNNWDEVIRLRKVSEKIRFRDRRKRSPKDTR